MASMILTTALRGLWPQELQTGPLLMSLAFELYGLDSLFVAKKTFCCYHDTLWQKMPAKSSQLSYIAPKTKKNHDHYNISFH